LQFMADVASLLKEIPEFPDYISLEQHLGTIVGSSIIFIGALYCKSSYLHEQIILNCRVESKSGRTDQLFLLCESFYEYLWRLRDKLYWYIIYFIFSNYSEIF
jgi:hypothetical protein